MKLRLLLAIFFSALLLVACDDNNEERDTGPNANLSNQELLTKAVADMKALKSHHFELEGTLPTMPYKTLIIGDIQSDEKGSRIKAIDHSSTSNSSPTPLDIADDTAVEVIMVNGDWYESYDGGTSWDKPHIDTPAYLVIASGGLIWDPRFSFGYPAQGENMIHSLEFKEGTPKTERIDGVMTRHMIAEPIVTPELSQRLSVPNMDGAKSLSIWVSTEITPTIRQMTIEGSLPISGNEQTSGRQYATTWKWSRFNEDFGVISPPPPEKIKTPTP